MGMYVRVGVGAAEVGVSCDNVLAGNLVDVDTYVVSVYRPPMRIQS